MKVQRQKRWQTFWNINGKAHLRCGDGLCSKKQRLFAVNCDRGLCPDSENALRMIIHMRDLADAAVAGCRLDTGVAGRKSNDAARA